MVCREFGITPATPVWNSDESGLHANEPTAGEGGAVWSHDPKSRAPYVIAIVENVAESGSLVATIFADASPLPLFVINAGSGRRLQFAEIECDGSRRRRPLAGYQDDGAQGHRREKPSFHEALWDVIVGFVARSLFKRCAAYLRVLLMDGFKFHALPVGLRMLKAARWWS